MNYTDMQPGDLVVFDFDNAIEVEAERWKSVCKYLGRSPTESAEVMEGPDYPIVNLGNIWFHVSFFRPAPIVSGMSVRLVDADDIDEPWETEISRLFRHEGPVVVLAVKDAISVAFKEGGLLFDITRFRPVAPGTKVRHALPGDPLGLQMLMQPPLDYPEAAEQAERECDALEDALWALLHPTDPSALRDAEAIARQDAPAAPAPGPVEFTDPVTGQRLLRYPPEVMRTHAGDEWVWVHTRGVR